MEAIDKAGYQGKIQIGMDVAASEFCKEGKYDLDFKNPNSNPSTWVNRNSSLKGKFSSGIEGALASTLNHNFNWKQLSEMILCIFLLMFSKFIWVTLIQKQQKYK